MNKAAGNAGRRHLAHSALIAIIFLAAILPIMASPVLPMIDFYNHLARYFVLAHIDGDPFLQTNYQSHWAILPNIGLDVIGAGLMRIAGPLAVSHVIVIFIFFAQYFGVLLLNRQLNGSSSILVAILTVPLLYSFIFTWGFANFLLGLGLVFWAVALRLMLRHRPVLCLAVGSICAVVVFLTHGVAFALYGLLAGAIEVGLFIANKPRRLSAFLGALAGLALQAVVPAILFMVSATSKAPEGFTNADEAVQRLGHNGLLLHRLQELLLYRLTTIVRVSESPSLLLDLTSFVAIGLLLAALLVRRRIRFARPAWVAIGMGLVLVMITPPTLFGVGYVADRMPLFLALLALSALAVERPFARLDTVLVAAIALTVSARVGYTAFEWRRHLGDFADFRSSALTIPPRQLVGYVDAANSSRLGDRPRCDMYGPLLVSLDNQASPLFAIGTQQPLRQTGPLLRAAAGLHGLGAASRGANFAPDRLDAMIAQGRFDYVLVCDAYRLGRPLPANAAVVSHQGRFTVLKSKPSLAADPQPSS